MKRLIILKKYYPLLIPLLLIIGASLLFLYRLGMPTLEAWDEAWYGAVAQTIVKSNNWIFLKWQGEPFLDHPPMGMWLMAISYKLFGVSEFSTRLPSVLAGIATILLLYFTGLKLYKKKVIGVVSSLIIATCVWYVLRVRSGNLDSLLAFFFMATFYFSLRSRDTIIWFPVSMLFLGFLIMTKTLVGFAIVPIVVLLNWRHFFALRSYPYMILGILIVALIVIPWYRAQFATYSNFFDQHFKTIGLRNQSPLSFLNIHPQLPLFYLHMGIRKWYYLWIVASIYSLLTLKWKKIESASVFLWFICVIYPFLGSQKTELWHLIPAYLPLSLITASGLYYLSLDFWKLGKNILQKLVLKINVSIFSVNNFTVLYILFFFFVSSVQLRTLYPEVYPHYPYTSDIVDVGQNAKKYARGTLFLNESFLPIIAFYSGKDVYEPGDLIDFWKSNQTENSSIIVGNWGIDRLKEEKLSYKVLYKNSSYTIISK